jgi:nucleotide-binding universal stress UspA family protein
MAKVYDAEITGLVILDIPGIEDSIGPIPIGGIHLAEKLEREKKEEAKARIEDLLEKFKQKCEAAGVRYQAAARQGSPSRTIIKESIYFDLVVLGLRTFFHFETSEKYGQSLEKLLRQSITPVYGVPEDVNFKEKPDRKIKDMMAFDGSPLSARAMHRFANAIDPKYYQIFLLNASNDQAEGEMILSRAEEYLKAHHISDIEKLWTDKDIRDVVEAKYDEMDAFVVGAHAREGIFDFLIGSLTKYLVKRAKKPVFIGQ